MTVIRVVLPSPLRALLQLSDGELSVTTDGDVSLRTVLDALERDHPALRGTLRDHVTRKRRPFVRFYAGGRDLSHEDAEAPLPVEVEEGREPLLIVGAMAGG